MGPSSHAKHHKAKQKGSKGQGLDPTVVSNTAPTFVNRALLVEIVMVYSSVSVYFSHILCQFMYTVSQKRPTFDLLLSWLT